MASSSLTWPASRRRTICSNSASASSKLIAAMSADRVGSLICALLNTIKGESGAPLVIATREYRASLRNYKSRLTLSGPRGHQRPRVRSRARAECGEVVAALERRDHAAPGAPPGYLQQLIRYPGIIGLVQQKLRERVAAMRVEPGR